MQNRAEQRIGGGQGKAIERWRRGGGEAEAHDRCHCHSDGHDNYCNYDDNDNGLDFRAPSYKPKQNKTK